MSTRSCIAVAKGDSWEGVYVHSSGYPTALGPDLWHALHATLFTQTPQGFEDEYLAPHPGGYSNFPGYCYCHNEEESCEMRIRSDDEEAQALFIEWVYVLGRRTMTVFKSVPTGREQRCENEQGHWWMEPVYRWAHITQVRLDKGEPDWDHIETLGRHALELTQHVIDTA